MSGEKCISTYSINDVISKTIQESILQHLYTVNFTHDMTSLSIYMHNDAVNTKVIRYAWVTLATNDAYSLGALVLAHSLRRVNTKYELAILTVSPGVSQSMRDRLSRVFSVVMEVDIFDSKDEANLALLARPELGVTFTKLHCWRLTQYEKCVFLDADTLVIKNCDELFEREELSAAPDVGWPDCFNSGVFVYKPSLQTFTNLTAMAADKGSFDGGDQGLLNMYFSDWARKDISKHLPFIYNMCSTATYSYLPAFKQFGDDVRIIHFIGSTKPWLQYFDPLTGIVQPLRGSTHLQPLLQLWWNIFCEKVHPQLSSTMATSTLAPIWHEFSPMSFESSIPRSPIYTDIQNKTPNDIYLEPPDFSEFQDPWENYHVQNDSVTHEAEKNERQQYYSTPTINSSSSTTVLSDQFSYLKSIHQTHYESSSDHNREFYHNQQYNDYISSSYTEHYHNQIQTNQFMNETEQHQLFSHPSDTSTLNVQCNHNIENCVPMHRVHHHSSESQHQHVDYQCFPESTNNNRLVLKEKEQNNQQVDYAHISQHSFNNSNKSLSEEIQHQHNESYVDHHCSHCQMFNNVNNKQSSQHYEQENETCQALEINIDHDHHVQNNIAYQNDILIKQNTEQNENVNVADNQIGTLTFTNPHPDSKPCTDFHNVATQSDPHIMDDLNSSNAGLAGALAEMTLGSPKSLTQIALEERMRKQSWEEGHIDYMGRDSFDNIWKKIRETVDFVPPQLSSHRKEIQETQKPLKTTIDKTDECVESAETNQSSVESLDEVDKRPAQATTSHSKAQSLVNNVPITNVPKLSEDQKSKSEIPQIFSTKPGSGTFMDSSSTNLSTQASHKEVVEFNTSSLVKEDTQQTSVPIISSNLIQSGLIEEQKEISTTQESENKLKNVEDLKITVDIHQIKQPDIKNEKHTKQLLTASEILTVSSVPIQVAESVLQMEPKKSMSDFQMIPQEILPSTITSVHLTETEDKIHINSPTSSKNDFAQDKEKLSLDNTTTIKNIDTASKLNESLLKLEETSQMSLPVEKIQPQLTEISVLSSGNLETPEKPMQTETIELEQQSTEDECCIKETIKLTDILTEYEVTKPSSGKTPVRPSRTKELNAPLTSVPKTAQSDSADQEKVAKKPIQKSISEGKPIETTDGDGTEKKVAKKIMKKVTRKTKTKSEEGLEDGATDSSSSSKQKKSVKVVKKGVKALQTPVTDTAVSETPSSSTSDAPIPPKRKTKTTTAKLIKKSDIEQ
ncbi:Glycogenin-1 [Eufriesea mexicana]|uniref:glycogenin glucosyltransferase n=2 Tax=Eufriesea mexicana TaxID=516756 RepID=A0A310SP96_9HYME|nr:Glycogenin-1 [Eufriesea mexicana]